MPPKVDLLQDYTMSQFIKIILSLHYHKNLKSQITNEILQSEETCNKYFSYFSCSTLCVNVHHRTMKLNSVQVISDSLSTVRTAYSNSAQIMFIYYIFIYLEVYVYMEISYYLLTV